MGILVNSTGIFTQSLLEDMPVADSRGAERQPAAVFLCARVLTARCSRGWGRIINIASQLGQIGGIEAVHYWPTRWGDRLAKALAGRSRGVLSNAIARAPSRRRCWTARREWRSAKLAELPMRRFGTVAEVTPTAVLLASSDGDYYAGQTLGPNGGDVML